MNIPVNPTSQPPTIKGSVMRAGLIITPNKRLSYRFVPIEQSLTQTKHASEASDDFASQNRRVCAEQSNAPHTWGNGGKARGQIY